MFSGRNKMAVLLILLLSFISYSFFLYTRPPAGTEPATKEAASGKWVWQKYNCNACHQVYGLGGFMGPDLTNVYSAKGGQYIRAFLKTGTNAMPVFHLTDDETTALLAFLNDIDASGEANPKTFTINYDGTIEK